MKVKKPIKDKVFKIKAHIDMLKEDFAGNLYDTIMDSIPYDAEDDVFEFELVLRNMKNITEEVGVDKEGCRAFCAVKIKEVK